MSINARNETGSGGLAPLTRRDVMKVGAGAAVLGLASVRKAVATGVCPRNAELFAFRASDSSTLVFAVAFPMTNGLMAGATTPSVRIHARSMSWTVESANESPSVTPRAARVHAFVGRATKPTALGETPHHLIVVAAPAAAFAPGDLAVWAEVSGAGGSRLRVGNPIVAELLTRDPSLARIFHKAHPTHDRVLFAQALAERIATQSSATNLIDPQVRGERLAAMLLPDVLPFDPAQPVGFTFAGQNGRRLANKVADVVDTVLAGVVAPRPSAEGLFRASKAFPYVASDPIT